MDYRDIEAFLEIAKTHNITKSAENLFLSQSSVSHRLRQLEQELGASLVMRRRGMRSVELTARGESFVPLAERWMEIYRETEACMKGPEMNLSVGSIDSITTSVLYPLYRELIRQKNGLNLFLTTQSSIDLYRALENQQIDVGFVGHQYHRQHILVRPIFRQEMCVISQNPRIPPEKTTLHPRELDPILELFTDWGPEYRVWHDRWWNSAIRPRVIADTSAMIRLLMNGDDYWAVVPLNIANELTADESTRAYRLEAPPPDRICYMITHQYPKAGRRQAMELFEQLLMKMVDQSLLIRIGEYR